MQSEGLSENELTKEESVWEEKDQDVLEEVTSAKKKMFTLKELLEIFHNIESMKDKMLEADPNLEKIRTICQGRERKSSLCSYAMREKNQTRFNLKRSLFLQRNKIF